MQYQALAVKQVKKYKLQHTNAFVSYNRENECLFGCKLSRPSPVATRPLGHKKGF